jgi:protease I
MAKILIPLPAQDFDPTEAAIPWRVLRQAGHEILFATPEGLPAQADPRMLDGHGLGPFKPFLVAEPAARQAYSEMAASPEFKSPLTYEAIARAQPDGFVLPGGHAPGMRTYLESEVLQARVGEAIQAGKPVGAICHGVLLAARARTTAGRSALFGKKVTALPRWMELNAWALTALWLGTYYRTYPKTVEQEVKEALRDPSDFSRGPLSLQRDRPDRLARGFVVRDGNLITARWPGDAHRFAQEVSGSFW